MFGEVMITKRYLGARFGTGESIPAGEYSIPTNAARGKCFMKVRIERDGSMSGFELFWDEQCTVSYHHQDQPTSVLPESDYAKAFRKLMDTQPWK